MAVDVSIKVGQGVTVPDLILPGVHYGVVDDFFRLEEGKVGQYTVVYDPKNICRGLELSLELSSENERAELRLALPCGWQDVHFFYGYVWELCQKYHTEVFVREGERVRLSDIDKFIAWDIAASERALRQMEDGLVRGEYRNMSVCGVMNPICFNTEILRRIDGDTKKLDEFMHSLQSRDLYYAKASVYQRKDGSLFGVYTLTENVVSVLPEEPELKIPNDLPKVEDWNLGLVFDNKFAGAVPYQAFLAYIGTDRQPYDAANFVVQLGREDLQKLLTQARIDL